MDVFHRSSAQDKFLMRHLTVSQCSASAVKPLAELTFLMQIKELYRLIGKHRNMFIQRSSGQGLMINNSPETVLRWFMF